MFTMRRSTLLFVAVLLTAGLVSGGAQPADASVLERIVQSGELKVGLSGDQPPYNARSRDGQLMGLEVDLANLLAGALRVEAKFVTRPFPQLLDALEARGTTNDPCLREIVEAFVGPPLRLSVDPELGGIAFMRLLGHAMTQPSARIRLLLTSQFRDVALRFVSAIRRAVPELSETEAVWRVMFMAGAMGHALAFGEQVTEMYGDLVCDRGEQTLARRLVPFLAEGLRAPAATLETEGAQ